MYTTMQKCGNSHAIPISKEIMETADLHENDALEIVADDCKITITRTAKKHKTLEERIANYSVAYKCSEWDTGFPKGVIEIS